MGLTHGLKRAARYCPNRTSTVFGARRRTWAQTQERVARLAAGLASLGIGPGDRVALLGLNSDRYVEAVYAVLWAGGVIVPCNTRWAPAEHAYALRDSEPALMMVDAPFVELAKSLPGYDPARTIDMGDEASVADMVGFEHLIASHAPLEDRCRSGEAMAGLMYTGGTTGWPKGVMISHGSVAAAYGATMLMMSFEAEGVMLQVAPLFHLAGLGGLFSRTVFGFTHVILAGFDPAAVARAIVDEQVDTLLMVPTMIDMLDRHVQEHPADLGCVRGIVYGASPISESLLRRALSLMPNARFSQGYGQTEVCGGTVILESRFHVTEGPNARLLRAAGRPAPGTDLRIVDEDLNDVPQGQVGEVLLQGPSVMQGYWKQPELTAKTIVEGWVRTGDAGYLDPEGFLFLVDRVKDMIVSGGENVFSAEVENALAQHPAVLECAVIGVPDARWGEAVHAIVRLKPGHDADEAELKRHCTALIAGYKHPRGYTFRDEPLPLSAAGKVLKVELRKPYWADADRRVG